MGRLTGKRAVVTGAGRGLGQAVAALFAGEGACVVVADVDMRGAEAVAGTIAQADGNAVAVSADVTSVAAVEQMIDTAVSRFGGLDVLVNNAGVASAGSVTDIDEAEWDRVMAINAKAAFLCCRAAVPHMESAGGGSIVCISSASGVTGQKAQEAYNVSKHAVIGLVRCMAQNHAMVVFEPG